MAVPFDMLSKYAEQAVRDFYVDGVGFISRRGSSGKIGRGGRLAQNYANESGGEDDFLRAVLDPSAVNSFIKEYAGGSHSSKFEHAHQKTPQGEATRGCRKRKGNSPCQVSD